jgi:tetratricopeptide (TPR) repeat protein
MKQEMNYSMYVDRYLEGVMSSDEQFWFEKELQHDSSLQEEIKLQQDIQKMMSEREVLELESQLDAIYHQTYRPWIQSIPFPKNIKSSFVKYTAAVASVALIVVTTILFVGRRDNSGDIYSNYYQPAEISMSFRAAADDLNSDLRDAMTLYENKEYKAAIQKFEKILAEDNTRIGLNLYSGISHMEIEEYAKANESFQKIIDQKANAFVESAEWYLGLCYIKTNDKEKAIEVFGDIVARDGYFRKDARNIMNKLK